MDKLPLWYIHKLSLWKIFYLSAFPGTAQLNQNWTQAVKVGWYTAGNSLSLKVWMRPVKGKSCVSPSEQLNKQWHSTNLCSLWYNHMAYLLCYLWGFSNVCFNLYFTSEFVFEWYEEHNRVWIKKEKPTVHIPARLPNTDPTLSTLTPSDTPGTLDSSSQPELCGAWAHGAGFERSKSCYGQTSGLQ